MASTADEIAIKLGIKTGDFNAALADAGVKLKGFKKGGEEDVVSLGEAFKKLNEVVGVLGVALGAEAIAEFFKGIIEKGKAVENLSERLEVGTDALQAFDAAVRQAGGTSEQANQVWTKAKINLDALAAGSATAEKQFAALGLEARDFVDLNLEDSLAKIASAYAENRDAAGAFQAVTEILGSRSAPALNAILLKMGEEGLPALIDGMKKAGQVIDKETIKSLDEFSKQLEEVKGRLQTWGAWIFNAFHIIAQSLGAAAATAVNFAQGIDTDFDALRENSEKAETAIKKITPPLGEITEGLKKIGEQLDKQRDAWLNGLTPTAKLNELLKEQKANTEWLLDASLTKAERDTLSLQIAKDEIEIEKAYSAIRKEDEAHEAKIDESLKRQLDSGDQILTATEKVNKLKADLVKINVELTDSDLSMEDRRRIELEQANTKLAIKKEEKKVEQEQAELADLALKGITNLSKAEKLRYDLLTGQTTTAELMTEILQIQARVINGNILPGDQERLNLIRGVLSGHVDISTQEDKHKAFLDIENAGMTKTNELAALRKLAESGVTQEIQDRINKLLEEQQIIISITRIGANYNAQSTASLQGVIANLKRELAAPASGGGQLKDQVFGINQNYGESSQAEFLRQELAKAQAELAQRIAIQNTISSLGENAARSIYGDSATSNALQQMQTSAATTAKAVTTIAGMMGNSPLLGGG